MGPLERGRAHGEKLRDAVRGAAERWKASLTPPGTQTRDEYVRRFVSETSFRKAIERHTPDLLDEVRGIAEGAGLPFETVYAMQLPDEEWWFSINARLGGSARPPVEKGDKCTVLAAPSDGERPTLVGQNLDLPRWPADAMVLLRNQPTEGPESLVVTIAGLVGATGINAAGVAVCVNTLLQLDNSVDGLPVAFVVRGILARDGLAGARELVERVPHASGQAYTIGTKDGAVCLEASAGKVVPLTSEAADGRFVHTNHPLANDDRGLIGESMRESDKDNSHIRYTCASTRVAELPAEPTVHGLQSVLTSHDSDDHPICNHLEGERGGFTAASVVYELGAAPRLHVAGAPPCRGGYEGLGF